MTPAPARSARRSSRTRGAPAPAAELPVARVAVDVPLSHLDRPFDYLVPAEHSDAAQPGVRVRVRFAGRLMDGFLLERLAESEHDGKLGYLDRVVSAESVLAPEIAALARAIADRYAGMATDVLRLAIPPRHARVEGEQAKATAAGEPASTETATVPPGWQSYPSGSAFLSAIAQSRPARAVWQALPGEDWALRLAELAATAHAAGRGALLIVPDARDLARLAEALAQVLPAEAFTTLSAGLGPPERYRRFLSVRRGLVKIVAGTRAAAFAPVADLAVAAIWDDGDDLHSEQRAPYPHVREVLSQRSAIQGCGLLIAGFARTAEAQLLVERGWAHPIAGARADVRRSAPRIEAAGDEYATGADSAAARARLSPAAFAAARESLAAGAPVLVQVPRRGYLPALTCGRCRRPARCRHCHGPLALAAGSRPPACHWCGVPEARFVCGACGSTELRGASQGARRTAEELGRAFPGAALVTSAGAEIRDRIPPGPAIVVATPGAEPLVQGGYGAALLLDGYLLLGRPDLRAGEEAVRRWLGAAALVRPAAEGGRVVLGADRGLAAVQSVIRWDPAGQAGAELQSRAELGFPPAAAMASIEGEEPAVVAALDELRLPAAAEVLGPVPVPAAPSPAGPSSADSPELVRALVRSPQHGRRELAASLRVLAASRSARKDAGAIRIRVDPAETF